MEMNDENYLALRIDKVQRHIENQEVRLNQWAINYWTTVLTQLKRKWENCHVTGYFPTTAEIVEQHKFFLKNTNAPREKTYED